MKWRILSVLPDQNQMEQVKDLLEKELLDIPFDFDFTTNETRAREKLTSGRYDLVITSLDIPKDGHSLPEEGLWRGLGLAQWMEDENKDIPTILFSIGDDTKVNEKVNRLKNCELVSQTLGWEDLFIKRAKQALYRIKVPEQKKLNVDIFLNLEKKRGEYSFLGVGFDCRLEHQPLDIVSTEFLGLPSESIALEENFRSEGEWQSKLQRIGEKLMEHIFERDRKFRRLFWTLVTTAGGLSRTRIRFVVEKEVHPIALEAIYGPHEQLEEDYWMLHAPIYRTIQESGAWGRPLFHDEDQTKGPLNILIIESPTEGVVDMRKRGTGITVEQFYLKRLPNMKAECQFLKDYLESPDSSGHVKIGQVKLIPNPEDPRPFVDQVQETLEHSNRIWHIVHYAGHSYFDPDTMRGYVFFPGGQDAKEESRIKVVDLELLSVWLRTAQSNLVFLSSCYKSREAAFAFAKQGVPAIIGFQWDVEDDMAAEFTRVFYRILFGGEKQSLEYVFLKTRQNIYDYREINPIWAAPFLYM